MSRRQIWKVKRAGKLIGSWHFTAPGGARINTRTDDANKALKFRERWLLKNRRPQETEVQGAAEATVAALDATPETSTAPASEAPPSLDPPAAAPVALPALQADHYFPPPSGDPGDWAADAARAASGSSGAAAAAPQLDPDFLDGIIDQAATMLVELQIAGQDWSIKRGLKIKPGAVAGDSKSREPGVALWKTQLRKWLPSDIDAPEWLLAVIITAATTVPIQIANAEPLPKEEQKTDAERATSEAVGVAA